MIRSVLQPHAILDVPYGARHGGMVTVRVSATDPVNTYVLDADGRAEFLRGGSEYTIWAESLNRLDHVLAVQMPRQKRLYLLVENPSPKSIVTVECEVMVAPGGHGTPSAPDGYGGIFRRGGIFR